MSSPQRAPRTRSAFAAAFLSLVFPGLGHAYAGAWARALAFAALPLLALALTGGVLLRVDKLDLLGFAVQEPALIGLLVVNGVVLLYRVVAAVDAWQVARFLNASEASGGARVGRARLPLSPVSLAGLLAVVLVMAGGHLAVARYNVMALELGDCVFADDGNPECEFEDASPTPGASDEPGTSDEPGASDEPTPSDEPLPSEEVPSPSIDAAPTPIGTASGGTPAPTLPPWDGKERLNVLLVGADQRPGQGSFNTDTLIVVSVDPKTGEVAMFQVPRDMADVPVPPNARSVWGSVYRGKINGWFVQNRNRDDLWPGKTAQARGFNALKAILGELYGLDIRYWVMVNFEGFRKAVNTLGGVMVNVQIPVYESTYPAPGGGLQRVYIPAGPQHMTGWEALVYARSRHRAGAGDFDRGRRQQRILLSLREQLNAQAVLANLPELLQTIGKSVKTDIPRGELPKLLSLADGIDTKNVRSYVFSPSYYATEFANSNRGYIITPNVARIRRAVKDAFAVSADELALRERLGAEGARVWVLDGSGRNGMSTQIAEYLAYHGLEASAPVRAETEPRSKTKVVVYNGAETEMTETVKYLEEVLGVTVTTAADPSVTVDMIVTLGRNAPNLKVEAVG